MAQMTEPKISPSFTIEDIHKIREYDAERRKMIGDESYWREVHADALYMREKIKEAREKRLVRESISMSQAM
jgi:hypothetical protein